MSEFQFGANAIFTLESEARFNERRDSVIDSIKPANIVESIFAEELLHASWEMERVRDNSSNTAAEPHLNAAHSRASRNWHRSLRQLKTLQSARATHICQLYQPESAIPRLQVLSCPMCGERLAHGTPACLPARSQAARLMALAARLLAALLSQLASSWRSTLSSPARPGAASATSFRATALARSMSDDRRKDE